MRGRHGREERGKQTKQTERREAGRGDCIKGESRSRSCQNPKEEDRKRCKQWKEENQMIRIGSREKARSQEGRETNIKAKGQ